MNIYKEAIIVQDACNLSGVVYGLIKVIGEIRKNGDPDTHAINTHPAVKLFCDKLVDLAEVREFLEYSRAYEACKEMEDK